jgi:hypothetical protein
MLKDRSREIEAAFDLHFQAKKANIRDECLETSLVVLGAKNITLEDLGKTVITPSALSDAVERKTGLRVNWEVAAQDKISGEKVELLLSGKPGLDESYPQGKTEGYLFAENYPERIGHITAIIPDEDGQYNFVDISREKALKCRADDIAIVVNRIIGRGGKVEIAQIKSEIKG